MEENTPPQASVPTAPMESAIQYAHSIPAPPHGAGTKSLCACLFLYLTNVHSFSGVLISKPSTWNVLGED